MKNKTIISVRRILNSIVFGNGFPVKIANIMNDIKQQKN